VGPMIRREIGATVVFVAAAAAAVVGWGTASVPPATAPVAGDVLPGATLFRVKGCASCHIGPSGTTNPGTGPTIGPDLSDAASWAGERRPGMSAEEYLAESVRAPQAFISPAAAPGGPPGGMPRLEVADAELDALVELLMGS
ncbi:MAG TPA: c-type cytochrome, partial [Acidimicrobiales bacterium]